ncbi:hypothetical protein Taro_009985 [Colocasia esculenta]|uniref:Uncharacterized protein n=1 Tax=Colocasia esculenta TaxID=4460 RepID=A0A843U865_COLES|nr:hypothetical protein [Colocasia esculenta]
MDPVFSGCDGYREANVVCMWYGCVCQGLIGPIVRACSTPMSSACHRDRKECRVLNATEVAGTFLLPLCGVDRLHVRHVSRAGRPADVSLGKAMPMSVAIMSRCDDTSRSQPLGVFKKPQPDRTAVSSARPGEGGAAAIFAGIHVFGVLVLWEARVEREQRRGSVVSRVLREVGALLVGGTDTGCRHWSPASPFPVPHCRVLRPETLKVPSMGMQLCVRSSVYCLRTCVLVCSVLGEFPTEPVTREAHPYPHRVLRPETLKVPGMGLRLCVRSSGV